jgi:hypothetical protein
VTPDNDSTDYPAARTVPIRNWPFALVFGVAGAVFCAYSWATPRDGAALAWFLVDLLAIILMAGAYLLQLASFGVLRWAVPVLPFWVVEAVRRAAEFLVGSWAGGVALGIAGGVAGTVAGIVAGCLFAQCVVMTAIMAKERQHAMIKPAAKSQE